MAKPKGKGKKRSALKTTVKIKLSSAKKKSIASKAGAAASSAAAKAVRSALSGIK